MIERIRVDAGDTIGDCHTGEAVAIIERIIVNYIILTVIAFGKS